MSKSAPSYARYALVVYPWVNMYPDPADAKSGEKSLPGMPITKNIRSISFSRSKLTPSNMLTVTIVGPVHWAFRPGNWLVLRSSINVGVSEGSGAEAVSSEFSTDDSDDLEALSKVDLPGASFLNAAGPSSSTLISVTQGLPRFVGQISTVQTQYVSDDNGNVRRLTTMRVREWSDVLNIRVRYDDETLMRALDLDNPAVAASAVGKAIGLKDYEDLASAQYNAFDFAQMVLRLIGAISEINQDNEVLKELNYNYPEIAASLPKIPSALLSDLGLNSSSSNIANFITLVSGIQKKPIASGQFSTLENWAGILPEDVATGLSKPGSGNEYFEREAKLRPVCRGKIGLLIQGESAWNLISNYTDPGINEAFTDFLYTYKTDSSGNVIVGASPAVFVRDKPFTLRKLYDSNFLQPSSTSGKCLFTFYDDLPRITLDPVFIKTMAVSNTFVTTPNYVRLNFATEDLQSESVTYQGLAAGNEPIFRRELMNRFGGHETSIETTFIAQNLFGQNPDDQVTDASIVDFLAQLKKVMNIWYTTIYKTANVTLNLKDPGIPLTVGFNLQFPMGDIVMVGHIESVSTAAQISEDGFVTSQTQVELSRVMQLSPDGKTLDFIPIDKMFNLIGEKPELPDSDTYNQNNDDILNSLSSGAGQVASAISDLFGQ